MDIDDAPGRLVLTIETVTPLFLQGANAHAELRPASVRGVLRSWWRSWRQTMAPCSDVENLAVAEAQVFGNTNGASPFSVRIHGSIAPKTPICSDMPSGLKYLWYGVAERGALPAERRFELELSTRWHRGSRASLAKDVLAALWLMCNLGGLGARTRRGAGAIRIVRRCGEWRDDLPMPDVAASACSSSELAQALQDGLGALIDGHPDGTRSRLRLHRLDMSGLRVFVAERAWSDYNSALGYVGNTLRAFRCRYDLARPGSDYFQVKALAGQGTAMTSTVERAAFGLPLPFYFTSLPGGRQKATVEAEAPGNRRLGRMASPLHLRVFRLASRPPQYAVALLFFEAPLLPQDSHLLVSASGNTSRPALPSGRIMEQYRDYLEDKHFRLLEAHYG